MENRSIVKPKLKEKLEEKVKALVEKRSNLVGKTDPANTYELGCTDTKIKWLKAKLSGKKLKWTTW